MEKFLRRCFQFYCYCQNSIESTDRMAKNSIESTDRMAKNSIESTDRMAKIPIRIRYQSLPFYCQIFAISLPKTGLSLPALQSLDLACETLNQACRNKV